MNAGGNPAAELSYAELRGNQNHGQLVI
jgi:hypothetical protein